MEELPICLSTLPALTTGEDELVSTNNTNVGEDELLGPNESFSDPTQLSLEANQNEEKTERSLNTRKILAKLLGEEAYFKHLEQEDEFVYDSLKRKLKYFSSRVSFYNPRRIK